MDPKQPQWRASRDCNDLQINPELIGGSPLMAAEFAGPIWPANHHMQPIADPQLIATYFEDHPTYHDQLVSAMLSEAPNVEANTRGLGGRKIRSRDVWTQNPFRLLSLRAMLMFCKLFGQSNAYVADRWGNVMETGDYSVAHCHYESVASAVYFVDLGEETNDLSGRFELIDPRIEFCCPREPGRPSRGLLPNTMPGVMLMFRSELLHHVHPYFGDRPRMTLAWNIAAGVRPADQDAAKMEAPVISDSGTVN